MILQNISAPTALNLIDFDPEYSIGARNAVRVCLNIQPSEKVTVITDAVTREIAASVVHEIEVVREEDVDELLAAHHVDRRRREHTPW